MGTARLLAGTQLRVEIAFQLLDVRPGTWNNLAIVDGRGVS